MDRPVIFQFTALESFLGRHFQYKKAHNPSFSYAVWARRLSLRSPAAICMITHGHRAPGRALVERLKRELGLNPQEARYFDVLVDLKKSRQQVMPSLRLMKELEDRHPDQDFRLIHHDEFKLIANWYYWALLEWVGLRSFKEDPEWLASHMEYEVTPAEVREALLALERLGLFGRNRRGRLIRTSQPVKTNSDIPNTAIKNFHEISLKNAIQSLHRHGVEQREFQSLTLSLAPQQLSEAKKAIRQFIEDFCRVFDNPRGRRVHQLELSLIPLTEDLQEKL